LIAGQFNVQFLATVVQGDGFILIERQLLDLAGIDPLDKRPQIDRLRIFARGVDQPVKQQGPRDN
jgi:hypothetical protein